MLIKFLLYLYINLKKTIMAQCVCGKTKSEDGLCDKSHETKNN